MPPKKIDKNDEFAENAKLIRSLFVGSPLTVEKINEVLTVEQIASFNVDNAAELYDLLNITGGTLQESVDGVAVRNALGIDWDGDENATLSDRRFSLMEKVEVTLRGLQNREQNGSMLLARQMEVVRKARPDRSELDKLRAKTAELNDKVIELLNAQQELNNSNSVALQALLEAYTDLHRRVGHLFYHMGSIGQSVVSANIDKLAELNAGFDRQMEDGSIMNAIGPGKPWSDYADFQKTLDDRVKAQEVMNHRMELYKGWMEKYESVVTGEPE